MKKLNTKGFGTVEAILILIIVGLIAGVGYYVWDQNKASSEPSTSTTSNTDTSKENEQEVGEKEETAPFPDPMQFIASYNLPNGWTDKECKEYVIAVVPPNTDDPNCNADQPNTVATIAALDSEFSEISLTSCSDTIEKNKEVTSVKIDDCSEVKIDGQEGFKVSQTTSGDNFAGDTKQVIYAFPVDEKYMVSASYLYDYKDASVTDYTDGFNQLVESFKFK